MNNQLIKKNLSYSRNFTYHNLHWINKFTNKFMQNGNKKIVIKHIDKGFFEIKPKNSIYIIFKSISITKPFIGVRKLFMFQRKGRRKKIILIPIPLKVRSQFILALAWLIDLILIQKKSRHRHKYKKKIVIFEKKRRGMSVSKKKTFYDRFYVTLPSQKLNNLIKTKLLSLDATKYSQLIRRKLNFYVTITNNRTNDRFRWV